MIGGIQRRSSAKESPYYLDSSSRFDQFPRRGILLALRADSPVGRRPKKLAEVCMWNWFNCYLSGRHDYSVSCESGAIFLRCPHCGRRSPGWSLEARAENARQSKASRTENSNVIRMRVPGAGRVLPFTRAVS